MLRLFLFVTLLASLTNAFLPPNPCPRFFTYKHENNVYYGQVRVPNVGSSNFNLAVYFSVLGKYKNLKPRIKRLTSDEQLRAKAKFVYFRIDFPRLPHIPRFTKVVFNQRIFCQGPPEKMTSRGVTNFWIRLTRS
nr:PREDICTED: uncharacterized protein LOC103313312 [Tribolium castaneum]|eukprot:XP_008194523.1 PREDICTED: uncharacterized protein LOC103313312 [Tribolium castaneum]